MMTKRPKTFVIQPIDIDAPTWMHLFEGTGQLVDMDETHIWLDLSAHQLEAHFIDWAKRLNQFEWVPAFRSELESIVPNLRVVDAYRFVTDRKELPGIDTRDGVPF
jgi:hypothetical protein